MGKVVNKAELALLTYFRPMNKLVIFLAMLPAALMGQTLSSVESVEFDAVSHRFFASNGNTIIIVDGNGNEVDYFGSDPESDYGMEVMDTVLYGISGSSVKGFGLVSGTQVMSKAIPGAIFLNGMASDGDHRLWVTDFNAKKIHELDVTDFSNVTTTEVVSNTTTTPNGIVYDAENNRLVFVNWGSGAKIKAVDLATYEVTTLLTTTLGNLDGIDLDDDGSFYVSSWSPNRITRFTNEFVTDEIITAPGISSPADICVAVSIDTLAIPNSGNNTITFVGLSVPDFVNAPFAPDDISLMVYPNPATEASAIGFELRESNEVELLLYDDRGTLVRQLLSGVQPAGKQKVLLTGLNLAPGTYICSLKVGEQLFTTSFTR